MPLLPLDQFDEVFAIDGGSTDGTIEYLRARGITVHPQDLPTYNGAYRCAFNHCTTDALVFFHPKGTIDPQAVLEFRPLFEQRADLVIASRIGPGARNEEDDQLVRHRKWFVMGLGLLLSVLWRRSGPLVWDVLHGFRGMRKAAFLAIDPLPNGVSIDLEMVARGVQARTSNGHLSGRGTGATRRLHALQGLADRQATAQVCLERARPSVAVQSTELVGY